MPRIQTTHDYHPIEQATATWALFRAEMEKHAIRSEAYRQDKEDERRDHDAERDAQWKPPAN